MPRVISMKDIKLIANELLVPDQAVTHVWDIDLEILKADGIHTLFIDLDNTLMSNHQRNISLQHLNWVQKCKDFGFGVFIVSNNRSKKRVQRIVEQVKCHGIFMAMKPFTFSLHQLAKQFDIELTKSAMIGDQVFKDIIVGKWLRMYSILVEPIDNPLPLVAKAQQSFEQYLIKKVKIEE